MLVSNFPPSEMLFESTSDSGEEKAAKDDRASPPGPEPAARPTTHDLDDRHALSANTRNRNVRPGESQAKPLRLEFFAESLNHYGTSLDASLLF